jgi:hypothetical protein
LPLCNRFVGPWSLAVEERPVRERPNVLHHSVAFNIHFYLLRTTREIGH